MSNGYYDQLIDLLGLPLDGSNREVHGYVRSSASNFNTIMRLLEVWPPSIAKKVNTVLCRRNLADLDRLARLVESLAPCRWSIYEFWAVGDRAIENSREFALSSGEYRRALADLRSSGLDIGVSLESGTVDERAPGYFFTSHSGDAYCIDPTDAHSYLPLGSIFSADVAERWSRASSTTQNLARARKRRYE